MYIHKYIFFLNYILYFISILISKTIFVSRILCQGVYANRLVISHGQCRTCPGELDRIDSVGRAKFGPVAYCKRMPLTISKIINY